MEGLRVTVMIPLCMSLPLFCPPAKRYRILSRLFYARRHFYALGRILQHDVFGRQLVSNPIRLRPVFGFPGGGAGLDERFNVRVQQLRFPVV